MRHSTRAALAARGGRGSQPIPTRARGEELELRSLLAAGEDRNNYDPDESHPGCTLRSLLAAGEDRNLGSSSTLYVVGRCARCSRRARIATCRASTRSRRTASLRSLLAAGEDRNSGALDVAIGAASLRSLFAAGEDRNQSSWTRANFCPVLRSLFAAGEDRSGFIALAIPLRLVPCSPFAAITARSRQFRFRKRFTVRIVELLR